MGIFNKPDEQPKQKNGATIIADGTSISGEINTEGSIHIDGYFNGDITATSSITVGKTGQIYGKINSNSLMISGFVEGEIDVDNIHIFNTGKISGKVLYQSLTVEQGGIFEGEGKVKKQTQDKVTATATKKPLDKKQNEQPKKETKA
jgi:cytoskeletal protein CcmA (bactofilin family)